MTHVAVAKELRKIASILAAWRSAYHDSITRILRQIGRKDLDPRHIEAFMRLEHRALGSLSPAQFKKEVKVCSRLVDEVADHRIKFCGLRKAS
jgi:hypothetical protein